MTPDDLARLEHGISLCAAPHERYFRSAATGYVYTFGCDECESRDEWTAYYVGPDPALLPSKNLRERDIRPIAKEIATCR